MSKRGLAVVRLTITKTKQQLRALQHQEAELVNELGACSLCGAKKGSPCTKPSGLGRFPHAERMRAATAVK